MIYFIKFFILGTFICLLSCTTLNQKGWTESNSESSTQHQFYKAKELSTTPLHKACSGADPHLAHEFFLNHSEDIDLIDDTLQTQNKNKMIPLEHCYQVYNHLLYNLKQTQDKNEKEEIIKHRLAAVDIIIKETESHWLRLLNEEADPNFSIQLTKKK